MFGSFALRLEIASIADSRHRYRHKGLLLGSVRLGWQAYQFFHLLWLPAKLHVDFEEPESDSELILGIYGGPALPCKENGSQSYTGRVRCFAIRTQRLELHFQSGRFEILDFRFTNYTSHEHLERDNEPITFWDIDCGGLYVPGNCEWHTVQSSLQILIFIVVVTNPSMLEFWSSFWSALRSSYRSIPSQFYYTRSAAPAQASSNFYCWKYGRWRTNYANHSSLCGIWPYSESSDISKCNSILPTSQSCKRYPTYAWQNIPSRSVSHSCTLVLVQSVYHPQHLTFAQLHNCRLRTQELLRISSHEFW